MEYPRARIICFETDGNIASFIAYADYVTSDWVDIVGFKIFCTFDDAEGVLGKKNRSDMVKLK